MSYRILALSIMLLPLSGCGTLIGGLVGAHSDRSRTYSHEEIEDISSGAQVEFHLTDGTVYRGRYVGMTNTPMPEYSADRLPVEGEPVVVGTRDGRQTEAVFLAFRQGDILIRQQGGIESIPLSDVREMTTDGGSHLDGALLDKMMVGGQTPLHLVLALVTESGPQIVPRSEISHVVRARSRQGVKNGLFMGVVVDGVLLAFAYSFLTTWDAHMKSPTN